ncbi:hypothetical protein [Sinorhizobium meliloti]|uniref:hypothetical protein n=1 Tax=Rhizobium meliloti TaxID=382 RepID=UPI000FE03E5D|nr:hypothetical protein [Sinorhizobium meliloti]MQW59524.1 hypothetical protein [Sinorhizobium meliloti]RVK85326.1 hypothetical protein CN150_35315 [Sinorhizobium meliloti]UIJ91897.1 hypothetical protein LZK74_03655 [Sinorhizobium meliloti]WKL24583.1 hypothetical protein Q1M63_04080 [Sinorhizobium meliloti]WKL28496.1 hypothetical protein Q1M65_02625 [Sinorhizobium meliloti]
MADIYPFPKTAEEQEAERQLTEAMHTFNAAIKHAVQCGFEIELRPGTWSFTTYTRTPVPYIDFAARRPEREVQPEFTEI